MHPIIGITGNYDSGERSYYLRDYYVRSIQNAGGTAIILPPGEREIIINNYIPICQGFLFSGGGDLDPFYWGELPEWGIGEINPLRDRFELALAKRLLESQLPILGICRGCQVINVAAGGSLVQDLDSMMSHQQKAPRNYPFHGIFIEDNTLLARILRANNIRVNSFHHQAVKSLAPSMRVSALAPDGTIEAIESKKAAFILGVQWHPECMTDDFSGRLFRAFVKAAEENLKNR